MKHWDEAIKRAREAKSFLANRGEQMCLWFAEFILEQQEQALVHIEASDSVQTARQLTMVQARCTELLEEVRGLKSGESRIPSDRPSQRALEIAAQEARPYTDKELDELWMWSKTLGWSPLPITVHRLFATIRTETKRDLEGAIERAGFRVAPDYHGTATLWCLKCSRDSGFHHPTCEKVKG